MPNRKPIPAPTRTNYEMHSKAGNLACRRLAARILKRSCELNSPQKLLAAVRAGMDTIAINHGEIYDDEPSANIFYEVVLPIASRYGFGDRVTRFF